MATTLSAEELERRIRLVDEHVKAEVERDLDAIMRTWGTDPHFDDVPWEEEFHGRDEIRWHYDELLDSFPDLDIEVHMRYVTDELRSEAHTSELQSRQYIVCGLLLAKQKDV